MSEMWLVVGDFIPHPMYLNQESRWWADKANSTMYPSREEAESAAFSTVTAEPSLIGLVHVEKAS